MQRLTLVASANLATNPTNTEFNNIYPQAVSSGFIANVGVNGSSQYQVISFVAGKNYVAGEKVYVKGSLLGGVDGTNDCGITINSVDVEGGVITCTADPTSVPPVGGTSVYGLPTLQKASGLRYTVRNSNGVYSLLNGNNPSQHYVNGHNLIVSGNLLGGLTPQNDLTFKYRTTSDPTEVSENGVVDYSSVKFTLPTSYMNIVYIEWVTAFGFVDTCFLQILLSNGMLCPGSTTGGLGYWRMISKNNNSVPDHLSIKKSNPFNLPSDITIELKNSKLQKLMQTTPWSLELVIYSSS